jgi:hypothetical protein
MQWIELVKDYLGKKAGERLALEAGDASPLIAAGIARTVADDPIAAAIAKGLDGALAGFTRGLDQIIQQTLAQFADAQARSRRNATPILFGTSGDGDPKKSFGDWCLAVARNDRNYLEKHYGSKFNEWQTKAALGESSGVTGGYTVPPEFYQQLQTIMAEQTFIRPRAFVVPMGSATLQMPYLDVTTVQSAGVSPFFGGVQMYWSAEAQTRTETEPQFKQMELRAWELSGYSVSSNVLLQDSIIGLEKFLMTLFAKAIAWYEEYAFLQGNGSGKPQGMLGASATIAVTRARPRGAHAGHRRDAGGVRHHRRHSGRRRPDPVRRHFDDVEQAVAGVVEQRRLGVQPQHHPATLAAQGRQQPRDLHQHRPGYHEDADLVAAGPAGHPHGEAAGAGYQGRLDARRSAVLRDRRPHADRDRRQRARQLPEKPDDLAGRRARRRPAVDGQARHAPGR